MDKCPIHKVFLAQAAAKDGIVFLCGECHYELEKKYNDMQERIQIQAPSQDAQDFAERGSGYPECDCGANMVPVHIWKCVKKCCQHEVRA